MLYQSFDEAGIQLPPGRTGDVKMRCPKCHGTRRHQADLSLSVNVEKGTWLCHNPGCEWNLHPGGIRALAPFAYAPELDRAYVLPDHLPQTLDAPVIAWFAHRGISEDVLRRNRVASSLRDANTICFPIFRDGVHVNTKFRTFDKRFSQVTGAEPCFYGMDDIRDAEHVIVVEGEGDKLAIEQAAGWRNVISFPNGAGTNLNKVMPSFVERTKHVTRFLLAGDADEPGRKLMDDFAKRVGYDRCWVVDWMGCKDANEALLTLGPSIIDGCLRHAKPMPLAGTTKFGDVREQIKALREYHQMGVPILPNALGGKLRIDKGFLLTITGIPGTGKSRLIDNIASHTMRDYQWSWAMCSPESWPVQLHGKHFIQIHRDQPLAAVSALGYRGMTDSQIDAAIDEIDPLLTLVTPESFSLEGVMETMKTLVVSRGVDAISLDPWNRMGHKRPNGTSMTDYVGESLAELKRFGQNHDVFIALAAHPRKPDAGRTNADGITMVGAYDIADSHNFYDMSDFILCLGRDKNDPNKGTFVDIAKVKNEEYGSTGEVTLSYNVYTGRLTDMPGRRS